MTSDDELLDELVFQVLERRDSGDERALEELCRSHPECAEELRRRVRSLAASGMLSSANDVPATLGEFRVLERLGQGGMGIVYLAEQPRLGRRVAVKMVRPEQLYFAGARERFQREVEAIARLSHPSIVPIFTVGEAGGVPYYAMEFVEGASLAEVLARLRGRDPASLRGADVLEALLAIRAERGSPASGASSGEPLFNGSWPDACAWLAREIAQALEHAHQRGVVHRDIKPSNILLTPSGRVLLTDFGLASTQGGERITRQGAQLGSLAYMPPEQVLGSTDELGARSDVYSLGVSFYEALTLELPFGASETSTTAAALLARKPIPPRQRNTAVAADFELVCATAMENDPQRRYASAAHFARDLTNLLQRRPIEARPAGIVLSTRRWAQRQPARATALALGLVAALVVPSLYALQESRAKAVIAAERDAARTNLDAALDAIELMLERVAHRELRDVPRVDALKKELLERATSLYERLRSSAHADRRTELRAAAALGKLARLRRELGDTQGALKDFDEAESRLRALVDAAPCEAEALFELGNLLAFATLTRFPSSKPEAIAALEESVALLRRSVAADPNALRPRHELVRGLLGLAHYLDTAQRRDEALEVWEEASTLAEPLIDDGLETNDGLELWLTARGRIGNVASNRGENERARAVFAEIVQRTQAVAQPSSYLRQLRAATVQTLARTEAADEGATRDAHIDELLASSHADLTSLARDFPSNTSYLSSVTFSWTDLGDRAKKFGELERAHECFGEARRCYEQLVVRVPNDARNARGLGLIDHREADMARERGDMAAAEALLVSAVAHFREALAISDREAFRADLVAAFKAQIDVGAQTGNDELVVEAARGLRQWERPEFEASFDAALGLHVAYATALEANEGERAQRWLDEMRGVVETALAAPNAEKARVGSLLDEWHLSELPGFAELRERAR